MEKFAEYFLENLILDFDGALDLKEFQKLIGGSSDAVKLLSVIKTKSDLDDFIFTMTEVLREHLVTGITVDKISKEFMDYSEQ